MTAHQERVIITNKLTIDFKTQWNSMFFILQIVLDYKDIFTRLKVHDAKYSCTPGENEWKMTKESCGN